MFERTPLQIDVQRGQTITSSTLPPSDRQNFGRSFAYRNITPGVLGYTFNNYRRAFTETTSPQTGRSLFFTWVLNTFLYAFLRVSAAIVFCSLAGYALARMDFPGKSLILSSACCSCRWCPIRSIWSATMCCCRTWAC